jgi:hypothetical protein
VLEFLWIGNPLLAGVILVTTNPDPQNMHDITTGKLVVVIPGSKQNSTHNFNKVSIVKPVTLERRVWTSRIS